MEASSATGERRRHDDGGEEEGEELDGREEGEAASADDINAEMEAMQRMMGFGDFATTKVRT